jgi:hypothetical protein
MTSPFAVTIFESTAIHQGRELRETSSWRDFVFSFLRQEPEFDPATLPQTGAGKFEKPNTLPLIIPAKFRGDYANRNNVVEIYALSQDFDGSWSLDDAEADATAQGVTALLHTTFNDEGDGRRFRRFTLLSRPVSADEYDRIWAAENTRIGGKADDGARSAAQMMYVPGVVKGRTCEKRFAPGHPLDVDAILATHPAIVTAIKAPTPGDIAFDDELDPKWRAQTARVAEGLRAECPTSGKRHGVCGDLAGVLASQDSLKDLPPFEQVPTFVAECARLAGFEKLEAKRHFAENTIRKKLAGSLVTGWRTLQDKHPKLYTAVQVAFPSMTWNMSTTAPTGPTAATPDTFPLTTFDLTTEPEPIKWAIQGIFSGDSVNALVAAPGSLKTWTALSMGLSLSSGKPWLGKFEVPTKVKTLIIDWESGPTRVHKRLRMLNKLGAESPHYLRAPGNMNDPKLWDKIEATIRKEGIGCVILDSLAAGGDGVDENSKEASYPVTRAGQIDNVVFIFIHHKGKGEKKRSEVARGHSSITAAFDTIYEFTEPVGTASTELTCTMKLAKAGDGEQVYNVPLKLTNAEGLAANENAAKEVPLRERIAKVIESGAKESFIGATLKEPEPAIRKELKAMLAEGEAQKSGQGIYRKDSKTLRFERIVRALQDGAQTGRDIQRVAKIKKAQLDDYVGSWLEAVGSSYCIKSDVMAWKENFTSEVWALLEQSWQWKPAFFRESP